MLEQVNSENYILENILTSYMDLVYLKDKDGNWVKVNDYTKELFAFNEFNWCRKKNAELAYLFPYYKDFFVHSNDTDEQTWESKEITKHEQQISDLKGELRTFSVIKIPFYEQDGSRKSLLVMGKEITLVKEENSALTTTVRALADFKFALDQSSIVATTDSRGRITYVNDTFCEISKYSREELIGKDHRILNSGYHSKKFFGEMWKTIKSGECWKGEIKNRAKDGSFYWVKTTIIPFLCEKGIPYQFIAIRQDITGEKEFEEKLFHNAYHDDLTGLRNRRAFRDNINRCIHQDKKVSQLAFIYLDLNRFKYVNDTLGHNVGDQILRDVSDRLMRQLTDRADIYRFGGDEFIIVLKNQSNEEVEKFIDETKNLFLKPFYFNSERIYLSVSLGVSLFPRDGDDVETLLKKADSAMYSAKENGNNTIRFYTDELSDMTKKMKLENALRQAVAENQFTLVYQPQFNLRSKKILGVEALIRWEHPTLGVIPPSEFIPLAEETGLIEPISEWVLETACRQNCEWQKSGIANIRMGINIPSSLFKDNLVNLVESMLEKTNLQPCYLDLEITESTMNVPEITIPILKKLKAIGVRLSIDDFGTGYSSLAYLKDFPVDCLKIDRSFIEEIQTDNGPIVKMIISMARLLNFSVIAEGIETDEQLDFLSQLSCDEGQGYLFSRPLPEKEIYKLLSTMEN